MEAGETGVGPSLHPRDPDFTAWAKEQHLAMSKVCIWEKLLQDTQRDRAGGWQVSKEPRARG